MTVALRSALPDSRDIVASGRAWTAVRIIDEQPVAFAFATPERRELFFQLLAISGIGVESALLILELGELELILWAVAGEDREFFTAIPGLGPARINALISEIGKRFTLPEPLPITVNVFAELRQVYPDLSPRDPALEALGGLDVEQALALLAATGS